MNIYYETGFPDELCHWGFGSQRRNHKYFKRVPIGKNKYRYFYSRAEYDSYLKNKRVSSEVSSQKEYERTHWNAGEMAAIVGSHLIGGSRASNKVASDLLERRDIKSEEKRLEIMKKRAKDYRKRGEENHDYSLVERANNTQKQINAIQKTVKMRKTNYEATLVGKLDKAVSTIASIPEKAKKIVSSASKIVVKAITDNPVTKLGKSLLGGLLGKKETKKETKQEELKKAEKNLRVNGIDIKIRR